MLGLDYERAFQNVHHRCRGRRLRLSLRCGGRPQWCGGYPHWSGASGRECVRHRRRHACTSLRGSPRSGERRTVQPSGQCPWPVARLCRGPRPHGPDPLRRPARRSGSW